MINMAKSKFGKLLQDLPPETKKLVSKQNEIADSIYRKLKQRNITQKEFAQKMGMKESQLCKILAGNANLTLKTIVKIETALNEDIVSVLPATSKYDREYKTAADHWQSRTYQHNSVQNVPLYYKTDTFKPILMMVSDVQESYGDA